MVGYFPKFNNIYINLKITYRINRSGCVINEIYLEQTVLFIVWLAIFQNSTTSKKIERNFRR